MNRRPARVTPLLLALLTITLAICLPRQAHASTPALASTPTPGNVSEGESLYAQGEVLYEQQEYEQALAIFRRAADNFHRARDREGEADALMKAGMCYDALGGNDPAYDAYQQELEIRREIGDLAGEGRAYLNIGANRFRAEDFQRIVVPTQKAIQILEQVGDRESVLSAYVLLSTAFMGLGDFNAALEAGQAGLPLAQAAGILRWEGALWRCVGMSYWYLERYKESIQAHDHALEIWREMKDPAQEALELERKADAYYKIGEPLLAAEAYADSARIQGDLGDLEAQASSQVDSGMLYLAGLRPERGIEILEAWLEGEFADGDLALKATVLNAVGISYFDLGDYARAAPAIQASAELWHRLESPAMEARSTANLGMVAFALGNGDSALEYFAEALGLMQEASSQEDAAEVLTKIAAVHQSNFAFDQALYYWQKAADAKREIGDRNGEVELLLHTVGLQLQFGNADDALALAEQAYQTARGVGYVHGEMDAMHHVGQVQAYLGKYQIAIEAYQAALEISGLVGDRLEEGFVLLDLGQSSDLAGDVGQAEHSYTMALEIAQELNDPYMHAGALYGLGVVEAKSGSYEDALGHLLQSLEIERSLTIRGDERQTLKALGDLHVRQGDYDTALDYYLELLDVHDAMRESMHVEQFRDSFDSAGSGASVFYESAFTILLMRDRYREAFELSERSRSRSFLDQLGNRMLSLRAGLDADLLQREHELRREISALELELETGSTLSIGGLADVGPKMSASNLVARRREYADLLDEMRLASLEATSLVTVTTMSLESIQQALGPDTTLVSYYVVDEGITAFVVTEDSFETVGAPQPSDVYRHAMEDFYTLGMANLSSSHPASLATLYQALIDPILPYLRTERVVIVPHQWLWYVPFAALSDGASYFGEQYVVYTLPSASTLQFLQPAAGGGIASPLVLGDPATGNPDFPSLPFAAEEAKRVGHLLGVRPLLGAKASESVLQSRVGRASILHLAAHGSFDAEAPLFSRIWLAANDDSDGRLNVYEVYGLDLSHAELVVLSGCQTNLGELSAGDDVVGLNRAFLYGAPTVVASLWSVDDEATGALMEAFYANLLGGMGKAEALQAAQLAVRTNPSHPAWDHPYYWAGFILSGDPGQVTSLHKGASGGNVPGVWILITVGVALAGGLGFLAYMLIRRKQQRVLAEHESVKHDPPGS